MRGDREAARHVRQIKAGQLTVSNGGTVRLKDERELDAFVQAVMPEEETPQQRKNRLARERYAAKHA